ncbi:MAG: hypothetical protein MJ237_07635 [bacterium]|nr:hypothetical protein [bacterium]
MNKLQIKAEVLTTIRAVTVVKNPTPEMLSDLRKIDDTKTMFEVLVRELGNADEQKTIIICWLLIELIDQSLLNEWLWDVIKSSEYNDNTKMVAFNMLKDLGNEIDYEVIRGYFEKFNELIDRETKELLDGAIMNPETQIDFMDFLSVLKDEDKKLLINSLDMDYTGDALANILIPVLITYINTEIGDVALDVLAKSKSQLAFHALENLKKYNDGNVLAKLNKALSELKISGIRIDNTLDFYKEILKESKPYKCYISFPDGHGNLALIFSRKKQGHDLQFLAAVVNPQYGILDAFGFQSMTEQDFYKIVDKFYNYQEKYEISSGVLKYIITQALDKTYENGETPPYEYTCWESILLDIEPVEPDLTLDRIDLNQKDIDKLCLSDYVQSWFFDDITSQEFKTFIEKLSLEYKKNNYNVDLDRFIADNFDDIYTEDIINGYMKTFNLASYLRLLKNDIKTAQIFYSLGSNYSFLTNIIRKSIYEYYLGKRFILKNQGNAASLFEKKSHNMDDDFDLLQLDLIISGIEAKWVDNE